MNASTMSPSSIASGPALKGRGGGPPGGRNAAAGRFLGGAINVGRYVYRQGCWEKRVCSFENSVPRLQDLVLESAEQERGLRMR